MAQFSLSVDTARQPSGRALPLNDELLPSHPAPVVMGCAQASSWCGWPQGLRKAAVCLWGDCASLAWTWRPLDPTRRSSGSFAAPVMATAVRRSALERPASHSRRDAVVQQFLSLADALARRFQQRFASANRVR